MRVTDELCATLSKYHPLWMNIHVNHPNEITPELALACDKLSRAGVPLVLVYPRDASKPLCLFVGTRHPHMPWSENDGYTPAVLKVPPTHVDTVVTREMRARYLTDVTKADALLGESPSAEQRVFVGHVLQGLRDRYQAHHNVKFTEEALAAARQWEQKKG